MPTQYEPDPQLYDWIVTQKQMFKKGKVTENHLALLQELDFDFTIKVRDGTPKTPTFLVSEEWETMFIQLEEYKKEHGHVSVPCTDGR